MTRAIPIVSETGLENYYGEVSMYSDGSKYWLSLDDHSDSSHVEVSVEFAQAFLKEFGEIPPEPYRCLYLPD